MPKPLQLNNHKDLEVYQFTAAVDFYHWLQKSTERTESAWLRFAKKGSQEQTVSYEEAREQAGVSAPQLFCHPPVLLTGVI